VNSSGSAPTRIFILGALSKKLTNELVSRYTRVTHAIIPPQPVKAVIKLYTTPAPPALSTSSRIELSFGEDFCVIAFDRPAMIFGILTKISIIVRRRRGSRVLSVTLKTRQTTLKPLVTML
jgi:hypothetical protein